MNNKCQTYINNINQGTDLLKISHADIIKIYNGFQKLNNTNDKISFSNETFNIVKQINMINNNIIETKNMLENLVQIPKQLEYIKNSTNLAQSYKLLNKICEFRDNFYFRACSIELPINENQYLLNIFKDTYDLETNIKNKLILSENYNTKFKINLTTNIKDIINNIFNTLSGDNLISKLEPILTIFNNFKYTNDILYIHKVLVQNLNNVNLNDEKNIVELIYWCNVIYPKKNK